MKTHNLDTLRILHIIKGVLTILFAFFPLIYVVIGGLMTSGVMPNNNSDQEAGIIFIVIGLIFFLIILAFSLVSFLAAKYIKEKKNYKFIFAAGIICCIGGMLSIALGIFTIIELLKEDVKIIFNGEPSLDSDDDIEVLNLKS